MASTQFMDLTNELLRRLNEVTIAEADFASVRGVQAMAKDVINASINKINQFEPNWPFNVNTATQVCVVGQTDYDYPIDLKLVNWRSFFIIRDDTLSFNGQPLEFVSRDVWLRYFKEQDLYQGTDGVSVPRYVFEKHGFGFAVTPSPDKAYTVTFDYWQQNTDLVDYDDMSTIPSNYDEVIMQGGLYHFYLFRSNTQQATVAEDQFTKSLQHMRSILINKESTVRGSGYFKRNRPHGPYAENLLS